MKIRDAAYADEKPRRFWCAWPADFNGWAMPALLLLLGASRNDSTPYIAQSAILLSSTLHGDALIYQA